MRLQLFLILSVYFNITLVGQHTFSIVAVDSITGEIGSAGATCLSEEDGALWVSDIVLNVGAINTQAYWTLVNQNAAKQRMLAGDSPQEIIDWLVANDNSSQGGNIADRQYGIVDINDGSPRSAAYTGPNNFDVKGHRVGKDYAIQGNILISEEVLDDMEQAFINTNGELCDKLMASLQAAKRPGADVRCLAEGISSASAYIRVAKPNDTNSDYGNLWLDLNAWLDSGTFTGDPIDELQRQFDEFKQLSSIESKLSNETKIYPNPTQNKFIIESNDEPITKIELFDMLGCLVKKEIIDAPVTKAEVDIGDFKNGIYILKISYRNTVNSSHLLMHD